MKKPKISFRVIGKSGPLSLSWYPGPLGDAVEAENEKGVGFFSPNGELLSVEFDDVKEETDEQQLIFNQYIVDVSIKNGKVIHSVTAREDKKMAVNE